jgi:hypothetical protein
MTAKPESRWSSSFAQTCYIVGAIVSCTVTVTVTYQNMRQESKDLRADVAAMRADLKTKFITWEAGVTYAYDFERANRSLNLVIPDVRIHQRQSSTDGH